MWCKKRRTIGRAIADRFRAGGCTMQREYQLCPSISRNGGNMRTAIFVSTVALFISCTVSAQTPADVGIVGGPIRLPPGPANSHQVTVVFATGPEMTMQPAQSAAKII